MNKGWELYGSPTQTWDHAAGVMRCGQAVTKEVDWHLHARDKARRALMIKTNRGPVF